MKKILSICFIVAISLASYAQGFKGGLTGGLTTTQVDGDKYAGFNKVGLHGGIYTQYQFDPKTTLSVQLRYMPKGSHYKDKNYFFKIALHYIEVPITLAYKLHNRWSLNGGASLGYLFSYKVEDSVGRIADHRLYYKKIDLNVLAGVSYHFTEKIAVGLQFAYSLTPINTKLRPQYNSMLIAGISYEF